jgi:hypothetical protein
MRGAEPPNTAVTRGLIEKKLSELLIDDEAGWEAAADWIAARVYEHEGIEIGSFDSPSSFATAIMDQLHHQQNLQQRFSRGVDSLNDFEVAEELVWQLVPSPRFASAQRNHGSRSVSTDFCNKICQQRTSPSGSVVLC